MQFRLMDIRDGDNKSLTQFQDGWQEEDEVSGPPVN